MVGGSKDAGGTHGKAVTSETICSVIDSFWRADRNSTHGALADFLRNSHLGCLGITVGRFHCVVG